MGVLYMLLVWGCKLLNILWLAGGSCQAPRKEIDAALCLGGGERRTSLSDAFWQWELLTLTQIPLRNLCIKAGRVLCHSSSIYVLNAELEAH